MGWILEALLWIVVVIIASPLLLLFGAILWYMAYERMGRPETRIRHYSPEPMAPPLVFDPRLGASLSEATERAREAQRVATGSGLQFAEIDAIGRRSPDAPTRSLGLCTNVECDEYAGSSLVFNAGATYVCHLCNQPGRLEREVGHLANNSPIMREVRVEFDYDRHTREYQQAAVIWDDNIPEAGANAYTLKSPLIRSEGRALKVAEGLLAALQRETPRSETEIPRITETRLTFDTDREAFAQQCKELSVILEQIADRRSRWSAATTTLDSEESHANQAHAGSASAPPEESHSE